MTFLVLALVLGVIGLEAARWYRRPAARRLRQIRKIARSHVVFIGTSGSTDYLRDPGGDRRYWAVRSPSPGESPMGEEMD